MVVAHFQFLTEFAKFSRVNLGFLIDEFVRFTGGWRLETIKVYSHPIRL